MDIAAIDASGGAPEATWVVVVPAKPPARGKTRLGVLPDAQRETLARAFALDTVAAVRACPAVVGVLAVTDDVRFADELRATGADPLPDGAGDDLNATLVQAAREAVRRWPAASLAVVLGDLPALRGDELDQALRAVPAVGAAYVVDAAGTGTTVYAARSTADFSPRFGPGSAGAHAAAGAAALAGDWPSLRQDVDEVGDLGRALVLGVGPATRAATGL